METAEPGPERLTAASSPATPTPGASKPVPAANPLPDAELDRRFESAMASIAFQDRKDRTMSGALISMVSGFGTAASKGGTLGWLTRAAPWFCLWFAIVIPVVLVIALR